jgi:hypothetical protein
VTARERRNTAQREAYRKRRAKQICATCGTHSMRTAYCKPCRAVMARRVRLKALGVTEAQYAERLLQQGARCAICQTHQAKMRKALAADHDHVSGVFRGLLCNRCNTGLGMFLDEPKRLLAAVEYLLVWLRAADVAPKHAPDSASGEPES